MPVDSPKRDSIRILNPLGEDTSIMRTTAVPSMLEVLARNEHYHNPKAMLYGWPAFTASAKAPPWPTSVRI